MHSICVWLFVCLLVGTHGCWNLDYFRAGFLSLKVHTEFALKTFEALGDRLFVRVLNKRRCLPRAVDPSPFLARDIKIILWRFPTGSVVWYIGRTFFFGFGRIIYLLFTFSFFNSFLFPSIKSVVQGVLDQHPNKCKHNRMKQGGCVHITSWREWDEDSGGEDKEQDGCEHSHYSIGRNHFIYKNIFLEYILSLPICGFWNW